ncbi:MAG: hypothetical protein IM607_12410 [Cytophagales bacterium]|nr:hypothetical protein [Cytophagales bacterium]
MSKKRSILITYLLIMFLGIFQKTVKSQTSVYHPMLDEPYWFMEVSDLSGNSYYSYTTIGDTLIANQGYKKIKLDVPNNTFDTVYCLREDITNRTVFMWNGNNDILLYDFSLTVGSPFYLFSISSCSGFLSFQVTYIDSVQLGFGYTKRFLLTTTNQPFPLSVYVVEGVGSLEEPLAIMTCTVDPVYSVDCFSQNGVQIYGNNCSQMPPPNSVQNTASIINTTKPYWVTVNQNQITLQSNLNDQTPVSIEFFDLTGRNISKYNDVKPGALLPNPLQNTGVYLIKIFHPSGLHFSQKLYWSN